MEKLFYIDSYIKNFTAEIEEVKEVDDKFHVLLNKTAFFPGGGGQYCDLGIIDNINVLDVYEENDKIYHVLEKKPNRIHKVKCEIDWDRREYGMQHHFGQHIISACFNNEYKAKTVGFHLGKDFSTVDIEGFFKEEDILKIEKMVIVNRKMKSKTLFVKYITPMAALTDTEPYMPIFVARGII